MRCDLFLTDSQGIGIGGVGYDCMVFREGDCHEMDYMCL